MSNYTTKAINPRTNKPEQAEYLDYGRKGYFVRFEDGGFYPDVKVTEVINEYPAVAEQEQGLCSAFAPHANTTAA